jgi:hypothetical protein
LKICTSTSCENRWLRVLNFPLSQLIIKISIIFAIFLSRKAKVFAESENEHFLFQLYLSYCTKAISCVMSIFFLPKAELRFSFPSRSTRIAEDTVGRALHQIKIMATIISIIRVKFRCFYDTAETISTVPLTPMTWFPLCHLQCGNLLHSRNIKLTLRFVIFF